MSHAFTTVGHAPRVRIDVRRSCTKILGVLALAGMSAARAQALPPPLVLPPPVTYETTGISLSGPADPFHGWATELNTGASYFTQPTSYSVTAHTAAMAVSPGVGQALVQQSLQPFPSVYAEASASVEAPAGGVPPNPGFSNGVYGSSGAAAISQLDYSFEFTGPTRTVNYDVQAFLRGSATSADYFQTGSDAIGGGSFSITGPNGLVVGDTVGSEVIGGAFVPVMSRQIGANYVRTLGVSQFTENSMFTFNTGQVYTLEIRAVANAQASASPLGLVPGAQIADGFVDPTLTIDAGVVDPSAYHLFISDGVGNDATITPVPEPTTWAMLLVGIVGFGLRKLRPSHCGPGRVLS